MGELEKAIPGLIAELLTQAGLDFFPNRHAAGEQRFSCGGQAQAAFALILATAFRDPSVAAHDGEGAGEAGAVHGEHFAELTLGDFTGEREGLQDGVLGGVEAERAYCVLVKLGEGARGAAEIAAETR